MQFLCCVKSARFGKCRTEVCDANFISPNHIFMRSLTDDDIPDEEWRRSDEFGQKEEEGTMSMHRYVVSTNETLRSVSTPSLGSA